MVIHVLHVTLSQTTANRSLSLCEDEKVTLYPCKWLIAHEACKKISWWTLFFLSIALVFSLHGYLSTCASMSQIHTLHSQSFCMSLFLASFLLLSFFTADLSPWACPFLFYCHMLACWFERDHYHLMWWPSSFSLQHHTHTDRESERAIELQTRFNQKVPPLFSPFLSLSNHQSVTVTVSLWYACMHVSHTQQTIHNVNNKSYTAHTLTHTYTYLLVPLGFFFFFFLFFLLLQVIASTSPHGRHCITWWTSRLLLILLRRDNYFFIESLTLEVTFVSIRESSVWETERLKLTVKKRERHIVQVFLFSFSFSLMHTIMQCDAVSCAIDLSSTLSPSFCVPAARVLLSLVGVHRLQYPLPSSFLPPSPSFVLLLFTVNREKVLFKISLDPSLG